MIDLILLQYRQVHRAESRARHPCRSCASSMRLTSVMLPTFLSFSIVLFSVYRGLPRFLVPCGFHSHACLGIRVVSIRNAWPRYFHLLLFTVVAMSSVFAFSRTSVLVWNSYHFMFKRRRRHLRWNDASRLSDPMFIDQVSDSQRRIGSTLVLKIRSFVFCSTFLFFQKLFNLFIALAALLILFLMSAKQSPLAVTMLPRYVNLSTSFSSLLSSLTGLLLSNLRFFKVSVFLLFICKPIFAAC